MDKIDKHTLHDLISSINQPLLSTHNKLCLPIIRRIYKKMSNGIKFDDIKVNEQLIIDGHHRYISSLLANVNLNTIKSSKTSATTQYEWNEVEFVDEEWDTESKIMRLNELDAKFNGITLKRIIEIIK